MKLLEESGGGGERDNVSGCSPAPLMEAARSQLSVSLSDPLFLSKAANSLSLSVSHTWSLVRTPNPSDLGTQDGNSLAVTFLTSFEKGGRHLRGMDGLERIYYG